MNVKRIPFIDGLRGIAACAVVVFHFNDRLHLRGWAGWLAERGKYGVALFFVLSGFVITMSIGAAHIDGRFFGRFLFRRSLRLDPPYWCSMVVFILMALVGGRFGVDTPLPSAGVIVAHLFYLQDILQLKAMSPIYWSLCLEIQFYLFIVLVLWTLQRAQFSIGSVRAQLIFAATIGASMYCRQVVHVPGTLIQLWYCFALGVLTFWGTTGVVSKRYVATVTAVMLTYGVLWHDEVAIVVCLSAGSILAAAALDRLDLLSNPVSQFFGRISYSVYLTHLFFGSVELGILLKHMPVLPAVLLASVMCVGGAWIWYRIIERPSIALSHRIRVTPQ